MKTVVVAHVTYQHIETLQRSVAAVSQESRRRPVPPCWQISTSLNLRAQYRHVMSAAGEFESRLRWRIGR